MNFLAHLHLAHLADSSLYGNLLADFVRGNPQNSYAADIAAGIRLHRRIDAMTDGLTEIREARSWFAPRTRRVAPVTLDVMWDHFVSRHWSRLSPTLALPQFLSMARADITPHLPQSPPHFVNLNSYLWSERWMERYAEMEFIQNVLNGMANRRPRLAALRDSWHDLVTHYDDLERLFWQFYPRMMTLARQKRL